MRTHGLGWQHRRMDKRQRLFLFLFGLVFFSVAAGFAVYTLDRVFDVMRMGGWQPVPATVTEVVLNTQHDDTTTWRVDATFRYRYGDSTFETTDVGHGGAYDNIGTWQQDTHRLLEAARRDERPVTVWVDPSNPARAVFDRERAAVMLLFQWAFVGVFGMTGGGIMAFAWAAGPRQEPAGDRVLAAGFGQQAVLLWLATLFVVLFALPFGLAFWPGIPLVAAILPGYFAIRASLRWRRFGDSELTIIPPAPSLGGRLRCSVRIPGIFPRDARFTATLESVTLEEDHGSDESDISEITNWQSRTAALLPVAGRDGVTLPVDIGIPDDLPASAEDRDTAHQWRLRVRGEVPGGIDYDQSFAVAVALPSPSARPSLDKGEDAPAPELPALVDGWIAARRDGSAVELHFPPWRQKTLLLIFGIVGIAFGGFGGVAVLGGEWIGLPFLLTGLGGLGAGLAVNMLERHVRAEPGRLRVMTLLGGMRLSAHDLPATSIEGLDIRVGGRIKSGGKTTLLHSLRADLADGRHVTLGSNITNRRTAEQLRHAVAGALSLQ